MSRTAFYLGLILLSVSFVACSERSGPDDGPGQTSIRPGVPLPELLDGLHERAAGQEQLTVLDRLARPRRVARTPQTNRHDPSQTDTLRTLHYDGLEIEIYEVSASGKELASRLEVTGSGYETAEGLHVGSTREEVVNALGEPDETENGDLIYEHGEPTVTTLRIGMEGSHVAAMEWFFYLD